MPALPDHDGQEQQQHHHHDADKHHGHQPVHLFHGFQVGVHHPGHLGIIKEHAAAHRHVQGGFRLLQDLPGIARVLFKPDQKLVTQRGVPFPGGEFLPGFAQAFRAFRQLRFRLRVSRFRLRVLLLQLPSAFLQGGFSFFEPAVDGQNAFPDLLELCLDLLPVFRRLPLEFINAPQPRFHLRDAAPQGRVGLRQHFQPLFRLLHIVLDFRQIDLVDLADSFLYQP